MIENFIKKSVLNKFEVDFIIDSTFFSPESIMRAAYEFVDKVYMFFKKEGDDFVVIFKRKNKLDNIENIVNEFSESLVFARLREQIDNKTGKLRQNIINTAIGYSMDVNEVKEELENLSQKIGLIEDEGFDEKQVRQSKSIDEIISSIEEDAELEEDKDEIIGVLKEIEEEEKQEQKQNKKQ